MARRLTALLNGRLVGDIEMARSGASLPLQEQAHQGAPVIAYLENLLPDNPAIRERVATKVGAGGTDAYNMLEKIGRDCVGALQFVNADNPPATKELDGEHVSDASQRLLLASKRTIFGFHWLVLRKRQPCCAKTVNGSDRTA